MLINGKNVEQFLYNDIGEIHKLITTCRFNGQEVNLKKINEMFAAELKYILETMNSKTDKSENDNRPTMQSNNGLKQITENHENIQCIQCRRNCRKKASFCTTGKHWVHYNCEKLNNEQIKLVEDNPSHEYCCKFCSKRNCVNLYMRLYSLDP